MSSVLDGIDAPSDLKSLSLKQLEKLAGEIRGLIVHTIAKTGGHLAPNLGVVELTIALHKVFNCPDDKIVWDVGHQAYVHKILTGRRDKFDSIRQIDGLSGFPRRSESEYDVFGTGHASTSISAALGIALARDLSRDQYQVVAVIGDGSLTGGEAFEALNNAGDLGTNLIVILNDNEMSIAKNVGAMSEYLSKIRTAPTYTKVKHDIELLLKSIPAIGESVAKTVERVKDSLRYLLVPGMLFEELGFTYVGPIDGHNLGLMCEVFRQAKNLSGPVIIHTLTHKGKGYLPAECNADKFHGVGPFCVETGDLINKSDRPSYTKVFGDTLLNLAGENNKIVAITAAMPEGTGLKKFAAKYPARFFDVGIAEQHAVTLAAGMATQGYRPVVALYSTFGQRAYDQIIHDVCLQNLPVILALDRAGIVGEDGPTHHGLFDISYLRHIPNLTIMAPKDENELRNMLFTALAMNSPVAIRYPRGAGLGVSLDFPLQKITVGEGEEISGGHQAVFAAIGAMVDKCRQAGEILKNKGLAVGVVNMRFIKPLDKNLLRRIAREVGIIITVEDNVLAGGFGSAVSEFLHDQALNWVKLQRLGLPDKFITQGSRPELLARNGLTAEGLAAAAEAFINQYGVK